jgi:predicted phage baseplate assembly protein
VEIDNDGIAHLRFGDGELGFQPPAGMSFDATYRVGNGTPGNVGAEAISRLVLKNIMLSGVSITVRNPLLAQGGTDAEPLAEAKLFAPYDFRDPTKIQRAIIADDYEIIAERNPKLQQASAALVWTGSWYEADTAIDPLGREEADDALLAQIATYLEKYRRIGHDLRVMPAQYVPLDLKLEVCALPQYQRAHVKAALLDVFSNRVLPGGRLGFFHPDNLTFGEGIFLSEIVAAAQAVAGVECVKVARFQRLFESANHEIENGVLPLRVNEIAQLDNDPNFPEHGKLEIQVGGGR